MKRLRASIVLPRIIQWISSPTFVSVLFASVLLATLTAGLWPFHAPGNDATLVQSDSAIRFSGEGTAISDGMLQFEGAARGPCTIELWLKPASAWKGGTPLDFYNRERQRDFAISQDGVDLLLRSIERSNRGTRSERVLVVRNVFRRREFLLTLASDTDKLIVYIDGQLVLDAPGFYLSSDDLAAQLIVGNASRRNHGWAGEVKGLAIYGAELSASEGMQHVRQWSAYGGPGILPAQSPVAVFRFRGSGERVVSNDVPGGPQLILPQKYQTVDQLRFESAISELHYDDSYWDDAILNVLGFAPLGCVAALFWSMSMSRGGAVFVAILTGITTSFAIEYFQSYLPTRYSGTTDLITNSLGTLLGVGVYLVVTRLLVQKKWVGHVGVRPA